MNIFTQHHACRFGNQVSQAGENIGPLNRAAFEVSLVIEGELTVVADGVSRSAPAGTALFIFCNRSLELRFPRRSRTLWCHIQGEEIGESDRSWFSAIDTPLRPSPLLKLLLRHALSIGSVNEHSAERQIRDSLGIAVFNEYFRIAHVNNAEVLLPPAVLRAKTYLQDKFAQPCDLDQVAAVARLSPHYLIQLFRRHLGTTPIRYLWKCRAEAGTYLLKTTESAVDAVAYQCGFQSAPHFSRYLKTHYSYSPTELRRRYRQRQ